MADLNRMAFRVVQESTEPEDQGDAAKKAHGRSGGLKGGKARASKLSAARRSEIAKKAAEARWATSRKPT